MKAKLSSLVFVLLSLLVAGSAEELLPKFAGVGVPLLMAFAGLFAERADGLEREMVAIMAGAMEDALCGLPPFTGVAFFIVTAEFARWSRMRYGWLAVVYPAFQLWLCLWVGVLCGSIFWRLLLSVPLGIAVELAARPLVSFALTRAGIHEE